jgi:hypothetical protein
MYAFTPTPDNKNIEQLAQLEYADDNYWTDLDSIISSHVINESENFVDHNIVNDAQFAVFLQGLVPKPKPRPDGTPPNPNDLASSAGPKLMAAVAKQYPPLSDPRGAKEWNNSEQNRLKSFIRDVSFTCNNRVMNTAFVNKTYSFKYSVPPGTHGSEVDPLFYNQRNFPNDDANNPNKGWMLAFQSYMLSYSVTGDPNALRTKDGTIPWGFSDSSNQNVTGVLELIGGQGPSAFRIIDDDQMPKNRCSFWYEVEKQLKLLALMSS